MTSQFPERPTAVLWEREEELDPPPLGLLPVWWWSSLITRNLPRPEPVTVLGTVASGGELQLIVEHHESRSIRQVPACLVDLVIDQEDAYGASWRRRREIVDEVTDVICKGLGSFGPWQPVLDYRRPVEQLRRLCFGWPWLDADGVAEVSHWLDVHRAAVPDWWVADHHWGQALVERFGGSDPWPEPKGLYPLGDPHGTVEYESRSDAKYVAHHFGWPVQDDDRPVDNLRRLFATITSTESVEMLEGCLDAVYDEKMRRLGLGQDAQRDDTAERR